jgi:hypothetical protein
LRETEPPLFGVLLDAPAAADPDTAVWVGTRERAVS